MEAKDLDAILDGLGKVPRNHKVLFTAVADTDTIIKDNVADLILASQQLFHDTAKERVSTYKLGKNRVMNFLKKWFLFEPLILSNFQGYSGVSIGHGVMFNRNLKGPMSSACKFMTAGENRTLQTLIDYPGVRDLVANLKGTNANKYLLYAEAKIVETPRVYHPLSFLAKFAESMPEMPKSFYTVYSFPQNRWPVLHEAYADNYKKVYKNHGLITMIEGVPDLFEKTKSILSMNLFLPFGMANIVIDISALETFSDNGLKGLIYWPIANCLWQQEQYLKKIHSKISFKEKMIASFPVLKKVFREKEPEEPNMTAERAKHLATVDEVVLTEFCSPDVLVDFRRDYFQFLQMRTPDNGYDLLFEYLETMNDYDHNIAVKIKDSTVNLGLIH